jgi:hypothetical protein
LWVFQTITPASFLCLGFVAASLPLTVCQLQEGRDLVDFDHCCITKAQYSTCVEALRQWSAGVGLERGFAPSFQTGSELGLQARQIHSLQHFQHLLCLVGSGDPKCTCQPREPKSGK